MTQEHAWEFFVRGMGGDVIAYWTLVNAGCTTQLAASAARYIGAGT